MAIRRALAMRLGSGVELRRYEVLLEGWNGIEEFEVAEAEGLGDLAEAGEKEDRGSRDLPAVEEPGECGETLTWGRRELVLEGVGVIARWRRDVGGSGSTKLEKAPDGSRGTGILEGVWGLSRTKVEDESEKFENVGEIGRPVPALVERPRVEDILELLLGGR